MNKRFIGRLASLSTLAAVGVAHAEIPAAVTSSITTAGTDAATMGAAILVVLIGIWAFKLLRKAK